MNEFRKTLSRYFAQNKFPEDAFYIGHTFENRTIVVYGAGESFHYFKEVVIRQYGIIPSVILDIKFSAGDSYEGIFASHPDLFEPTDNEKQHAIVVICLGNQSYFGDVVAMMKKKGFRNIISLLDIYEIHNPFNLPKELELEGFGYYLNRRELIESCIDLLADDHSREVYICCLQTHMNRKPVPIPISPRNEQYTPSGIHQGRGASRIIYCGVSVGELERFLGALDDADDVVCFEPDPNQFALTAAYLAEHDEIAARVSVIPCAVYSHEKIAPFIYSDTSFGTRILESGNSWIQSVSIDHVLPHFRPTYIVMDIEGAELDALKGAEKTIQSNRPDLAICVYHSPSHLWEIPLYIDSLGLGYRFYLRNYTSLTGETVLYAVS